MAASWDLLGAFWGVLFGASWALLGASLCSSWVLGPIWGSLGLPKMLRLFYGTELWTPTKAQEGFQNMVCFTLTEYKPVVKLGDPKQMHVHNFPCNPMLAAGWRWTPDHGLPLLGGCELTNYDCWLLTDDQ